MRNKQAFMFIGLSAVLGIIGFAMLSSWLAAQKPEGVETVSVVVTSVDVALGTELSGHQLDTVDWPKQLAPADALHSIAEAQHRVLRRPLATGEPVLEASLLPKGAPGGLPSVIEENFRAVSVKVDPVIGVAGFVRPGARVDVFVTAKGVDARTRKPFSKLILQDIKVLAIDQKLEEAKNRDPKIASVVTLQVTPPQAEKLIYSAHEGKLQLALRNASDKEKVKTTSVTAKDLIGSRKKALARCRCGSTSVQVVKGSAVKSRSFCKPCVKAGKTGKDHPKGG